MLNLGWVRVLGSARYTATQSFLAICLLSFSTTTSAYFCANPADYQEYFLPDYASAFKACADDQNNSWDGNWYTRSCTGNAYQSAYGRYAMETVQIGSGTPCKRYWYPDAACPAGQSFEGPPPGECKGKYRIEIVAADGGRASRGEIEPGGSLGLRAIVYDQNGQSVAGVTVKLQSEVADNTGGHMHPATADHPARSPGEVPSEGVTSTDGFAFEFDAPIAAGDHRVRASCSGCESEASYDVWVGIKNLVQIQDTRVYKRIVPNRDIYHPSNHYLRPLSLYRLTAFATLYSARFPNAAVLQLNDASLQRGGILDISHNWKAPHHQHCHGTAIDIRANGADGALNIGSDQDPRIRIIEEELRNQSSVEAHFEIPKDKNRKPVWEARHFHTRLLGKEGLQCPTK